MDDIDIAVIGSGFSGLGAGIRLLQKGFTDFLIFERADDIGGTWRDNSYPGCACDVPSHLYSFSFALNPGWTDTFSGQREIWRYLQECVEKFGLRRHLRLGHAVEEAAWDEAARRWVLTTSRGMWRARVLISAAGPLSEPSIPDVRGLESFAGEVFHSARWRHDLDLTGREVAVIGTGASAVQFVPEIQPIVRRLTLFQRTPAWIMPRFTRRIGRLERAIYRNVPGAQWLVRAGSYWVRESMGIGFMHPAVNRFGQRIAERNLRRQVCDPVLREKLRPKYVMGCKRVLISNDFWPAVSRANVDVVTSAITAVRPNGIATGDGAFYKAEAIIFGTGFRVTDTPIKDHVRGRDGRTLAQAWDPTMRAYLGTTVAGFPNLFLLLGPNTGLGHTSVVLMLESQLKQVLKALEHMRRNGIEAIEPRVEAQRRDSARVDRKMSGTVWATGGCRSWYLDSTGRNSTLWPGFATTFRLRLSRFRPDDYLLVEVGASRAG
ncbi:flavin-containing monooxygenase [Allorhizocola rhizosphaerae]|uniref:flavin-containing monooxygenase n=1 Tax=Allorhizocola rhizosphaerae TaxID=1872709 RepID=UPI000E3B6E71|nr:NAD(P)/FAD-dependent oxidoreductase [Allorhizocola rhizosphaerae]